MYLNLRLAIACFAALTLTACASSPRLVNAPPSPLPAEYAVQCPAPPQQANDGMDAAAIALKETYDAYGLCAGRLVDLINWITGADVGSTKH